MRRGGGKINATNVTIKRAVGSVGQNLLTGTVMTVELLKDEGDFVVLALGCREATESELMPPPQE